MKLSEYIGKPSIVIDEENISPFPSGDGLGIEVELENVILDRNENRVPITRPPEGWMYHIDDSLRNNGLEFVFETPIGGTKAASRLESLITWVKDLKLKPDPSSRTSVHVHVNALDCTIEQLFKWLIIYTVYEPLLFEVFAKERKDSNFCVPVYSSVDTRNTIGLLKRTWPIFMKNVLADRGTKRYSAVNLDALQKFGSLEFRHLGGTYKPKPIIDWTKTLLYLKMWGMRVDSNINEIFHGPSKYYCQQMTTNIFQDDEIAEMFLNHPKFTDLYLQGVRTAQEIFLDDKIPEIPDIIFPQIEEKRKKRREKKEESLRSQIEKMKVMSPEGDIIPVLPDRGLLPERNSIPVPVLRASPEVRFGTFEAEMGALFQGDGVPTNVGIPRPRRPTVVQDPDGTVRRTTLPANPDNFTAAWYRADVEPAAPIPIPELQAEIERQRVEHMRNINRMLNKTRHRRNRT